MTLRQIAVRKGKQKYPLDFHTAALADGSTPTARTDRLIIAYLSQLASAAGAGAGDAVAVTITGLTLPSVFNVQATPSQPVIVSAVSKTFTDFGHYPNRPA